MEGMTPRETDLALASGGRLAALLIGLADLWVFYETHPSAPLPDKPVLSIRLHGSDAAARLAELDMIAEALGVPVRHRNGVHMAAREFGPLTVEAHWTPNPAAAVIARQDAAAERVTA